MDSGKMIIANNFPAAPVLTLYGHFERACGSKAAKSMSEIEL
jgi:hypothetical protein